MCTRQSNTRSYLYKFSATFAKRCGIFHKHRGIRWIGAGSARFGSRHQSKVSPSTYTRLCTAADCCMENLLFTSPHGERDQREHAPLFFFFFYMPPQLIKHQPVRKANGLKELKAEQRGEKDEGRRVQNSRGRSMTESAAPRRVRAPIGH